MDVQRKTLRTKTLLSGKIVFNNFGSTRACVVRDISDSGARLQFDVPNDVPAKFDLILVDRNQRFTCEIAWRRANLVGVKFEQAEAGNGPLTRC